MKLQLPLSPEQPAKSPDEVKQVLSEVARVRDREDRRVEKWLDRLDRYTEKMKDG